MMITNYVCNVCGKEYDRKEEAVYCHPDIIEKKYKVESYKNKAGKEVEFKAEQIK